MEFYFLYICTKHFTLELAIYIKNLLYNHDKVIIPGLGTLQTEYKPAQINSGSRTISPPSKSLVFDKVFETSDGVLANFISNQKKITNEKAEAFLSEQITSLLQKLDSGETVFLDGIGYFSKENNNIRFEPEQGVNFLTDSFGLSKIDYNPIEFNTIPKHTPQPMKTPKKRSYALLIVIFAILILAGGGVATYLYNPGIITKVKNFIKKPSIASVTTVKNKDTTTSIQNDTLKANDLEKSVDKTNDKKTALSIKTKTDTPKVKASSSFYIIAGSFKTFKRASILANQLKKEGYKPEVIQFDQDPFRVSLGEFADRAQADEEFNKIIAKKGTGTVWLLKKNL